MRGLQILLVLFISVIVADIASATGKPCNNGCGFGAICRSNKCQCRSRRSGQADFVCYSPRFYYLCQITSDPMLKTNNNERAGIKMPAALSLTSLSTRRWGKGRGTCTFTLNGWSERFGGKYFIEGLQFKLIQQKQQGAPTEFTFRIIAKVVGDNYIWTIIKKEGNQPWVQFTVITKTSRAVRDVIDGCRLRFVRLRSNFLYVNIMCCAIRFAIRPYNMNKPDIVPGFWVMTRKVANINSLPDGLCNNGTDAASITSLMADYGFRSPTQYTTFTGLAYGRPLDYVGNYPELATLQATMTSCQKSIAGDFMKNSEFLFNYARFIDCEGDKIMNITHDVVNGFCNGDSVACARAIDTMNTDCPNAKDHNKQMKAFLNRGCI